MKLASILPKVIILPGNGCTNIESSNWYSALRSDLTKSGLFSNVVMKTMPDPYEAKSSIWLPFIRTELISDHPSENTIVIGHSSGAVACMRLLEETNLLGAVLVSACHTDLGMWDERISGYYPGYKDGVEQPNPWLFEKIKQNATWIIQYHSSDDPFIPRSEADYVADKLQSDYTCFDDKSHFFSKKDVAHILPALKEKLENTEVAKQL